ncbi:hypothetical protein BJ742DRAFT_462479 [Cladochytrium replicatum]|nr:hypothetical protein BJ742DRAFT_462479 [Cladochytrium replicatum]
MISLLSCLSAVNCSHGCTITTSTHGHCVQKVGGKKRCEHIRILEAGGGGRSHCREELACRDSFCSKNQGLFFDPVNLQACHFQDRSSASTSHPNP